MARELIRCRVLRPIEVGGRIAVLNEIIHLRPDDAARLVDAGLVELRPVNLMRTGGAWSVPTTR